MRSVIVSWLFVQAVRLQLLRHQVTARDAELLLVRVAGQLDHVHPVEQRAWNRVERVGGADEEHLGEVEGEVEVVVAEARGAAPDRAPRASRTPGRRGSRRPSCRSRRSETRGCATRHPGSRGRLSPASRRCRCAGGRGSRPRHVPRRRRSGQTSGRARARSTGRATSCRRPAGRRTEDRARDVALQLRDRQVLDDPLLDLLEVEVILVEDCARVLEVEIVLRHLGQGTAEDPVEVVRMTPCSAAAGGQFLEAGELAAGRLEDRPADPSPRSGRAAR